MLNVDISTKKIKENVFTASPSKRCCVLETFLLNPIGFKRKDLKKWIESLSEFELKNKIIRLDGVVLDDFMAEYLDSPKTAGVDSLCMLTLDGIRSLFGYYLKNYKQNLTKSDKFKIEELSQKFISVFYYTRNTRINHLVFWEEEVKDEINIPDMPHININHSPGTIISTGDNNNQVNTHKKSSNEEKKKKPTWLIYLSWIFIIACLVAFLISIYLKYAENGTLESIVFDWKEVVAIIGMLIGILLQVY